MSGDAIAPLLERLRDEVETVERVGPTALPGALALLAHVQEQAEAALAGGDLEDSDALSTAVGDVIAVGRDVVEHSNLYARLHFGLAGLYVTLANVPAKAEG